MEHIIRPLILYALFLIITSYILKYIHAKDNESAILEYKVDVYLNNIRRDIIKGFRTVENMEILPQQQNKEPPRQPQIQSESLSPIQINRPTAKPYSSFFNQYYLIDDPQKSTEINSTQPLTI